MSIRVEPFTVGDFVHIYNRGNKKAPIFCSKSDYWRFLRSLRFFNDERDITKFARCLGDLIELQNEQKEILQRSDPCKEHNTFEWRDEWGKHEPLVEIVSYCLKENHFHLLLREIVPGGISKFMKKLGAGYTVYRNSISQSVGRVFQGAYKGRTVSDEKYLQYLDAYIQVFNVFELFDGGIVEALKDFDNAFEFALNYPFGSLGEVYGKRKLEIVNRHCFKNKFIDLSHYKEFCREAIVTRSAREFLGKLAME